MGASRADPVGRWVRGRESLAGAGKAEGRNGTLIGSRGWAGFPVTSSEEAEVVFFPYFFKQWVHSQKSHKFRF